MYFSIEVISKDSESAYIIDEYISRVKSLWWVDKSKSRSNKQIDHNPQPDLSQYEFVDANFSSINDVKRSLDYVLQQLDLLVNFLKDTSRYEHHSHLFLREMAAIWHYYLSVYPTPSRNEYVPKHNKRSSARLRPSRQFELFVRKLVPKTSITDETIRTALEGYRASLGEKE